MASTIISNENIYPHTTTYPAKFFFARTGTAVLAGADRALIPGFVHIEAKMVGASTLITNKSWSTKEREVWPLGEWGLPQKLYTVLILFCPPESDIGGHDKPTSPGRP